MTAESEDSEVMQCLECLYMVNIAFGVHLADKILKIVNGLL